MNEQRFVVNETPQIVVAHCDGNVVVKSWRETAVSVQGPAVTVEQATANELRLTAVGDLYLAVPQNARLTFGRVGGSLSIKHVSGGVSVDEVLGNVTLRNVDAVAITRAAQAVQGDNINGALLLQEVGGFVALRSASGVQIHQASGNVTLQFITGHVRLSRVDGKVDIRTVNGDIHIETVQGDVVLVNVGRQVQVTAVTQSIWLVGGLANGSHRLAAEANVYVYWPADAPLNLTARGAAVDHRLPLAKAVQTTENDQTTLTGHIEEGQVDLFVQAGQRVALRPLGAEPPRFSPEEFAVPIMPDDALAQKVRTAVRAALAGSADSAALEDRLVTALTAALAGQDPAESVPTPATAPPTEPQTPNRAESRTKILQLVRDGLISVDQANLLLDALP